MRSAIRLFKAVIIKDAINPANGLDKNAFFNETIQHGFFLAPEVIASHDNAEIKNIISIVKEEIGLSGSQMNSSFHKSWEKIAQSSICQLVLEQIVHYITTYGFERLGIFNKDSIYIPKEELSVPGLECDIPLSVIKGYTRAEMMDKLMILLSSGIALNETTIKDVVDLAIFLDIQESHISKIKNKEARVMLYDHLDKIPEDPVEFLRFIVYKATNTTLLIKNEELITSIKVNNNLQLAKIFKKYDDMYGFKKLSAVFNRFKPLFLAFKTNTKLKNYVNVISKLSKKYHEAMPEDYLNSVTAKISKKGEISKWELETRLANANVFRKARLAYALKFRSENPTSIMYKIRNGTAFSTEFKFPVPDLVKPALDVVIGSIVDDLKQMNGKKIYIPENIVYALPSSEKQFTGNIPSGSFVEVKNDLIAGIYWENVGDHRIDLDLALTSVDAKIGWDGQYRSSGQNILFSGDVTDASNGASEMFYVKNQADGNYILSVNYFNHDKDVPVPFTIFVGKETLKTLPSNYMINPNKIICKSKTKMDRKQKIMGLLIIKNGSTRFYFSETQLGNARSISMDKNSMHALEYLVSFYSNPITLNDLLRMAGATIITEKKNRGECDVDLSPENIDKESFLKILRKE
jgi:hypothetical protein